MIQEPQLAALCAGINANRAEFFAQPRAAAIFGSPEGEIVAEPGKRYARLVMQRVGPDGEVWERSAFGFVDMESGAILKAHGWKGPAKGPRGYIEKGPRKDWIWSIR